MSSACVHEQPAPVHPSVFVFLPDCMPLISFVYCLNPDLVVHTEWILTCVRAHTHANTHTPAGCGAQCPPLLPYTHMGAVGDEASITGSARPTSSSMPITDNERVFESLTPRHDTLLALSAPAPALKSAPPMKPRQARRDPLVLSSHVLRPVGLAPLAPNPRADLRRTSSMRACTHLQTHTLACLRIPCRCAHRFSDLLACISRPLTLRRLQRLVALCLLKGGVL